MEDSSLNAISKLQCVIPYRGQNFFSSLSSSVHRAEIRPCVLVAYKTLKTIEHYSSAPKRGLGRLQRQGGSCGGPPFILD